MLSFASDYIAGAHPKILKRLVEINYEPQEGYGADPYCTDAAQKIREFFVCPEGQVYFLTGGTQTNQIAISSMLANYEGVISADTGHIGNHEVGAIEYGGHKVLSLPGKDGKLEAGTVQEYLKRFYADENHEHMVFPGMVYISFPTENGTLYSKKELEALYMVCKGYQLPLYIDGARLGYGLASEANDLTPQDLASLCDAFYIGGTKVGALFGEALVFPHGCAPKHFLSQIKQHGALLAKGWLLGLQFDTLFTEDLYMTISRHAIEMAKRLKEILVEKGYPLAMESPTNQQFVLLTDSQIEKLSQKVQFSYWEPYDETRTVVRFAASWSTTEEDLKKLQEIL